jgi:ribosomal protein L17
VVRRYAHKLQGSKGNEKFSAKQDKEEREFLEAWQKEKEVQERIDELTQALQQAEKEKTDLESDDAAHKKAQTELDQMYNGIFSGPTPEVPGEDDLEGAVEQNRKFYEQCQAQLARDKQAMEALNKARKLNQNALYNMQEALSASNVDRFGGGALFDLLESNALFKAQQSFNLCRQAVGDANRIQPEVPLLYDVLIEHGGIGDVLFDNVFSDFAQHERIRNADAQMRESMKHLDSIITEHIQRQKSANSRERVAANQLEESRAELQRIRSEAFERLSSPQYAEAGDGEQPPAYSA